MFHNKPNCKNSSLECRPNEPFICVWDEMAKRCPVRTTSETKYCGKYHEYLRNYTAEQLEQYLANPPKCLEHSADPVEPKQATRKKQSVTATRVADPVDPVDPVNPVVPLDPVDPVNPVDLVDPLVSVPCIAKDGDRKQCKTMSVVGKVFCAEKHQSMLGYTQEQILAIKKCKRCKNYRAFNNDAVKCVHCVDTELPKCTGYSKTGKCSKSALPDSKFCKHHPDWAQYDKSALDRVDKCPNCEHFMPINLEDAKKWCDKCVANRSPLCAGLDCNGDACRSYAKKGALYCSSLHYDMNTYTAEQSQNITQCKKCKRYRHITRDVCDRCIDKKNQSIQCIGRAEDGKACKRAIIPDTRTCRIHDHMEPYTDYMIANMKLCKSCPRAKWKYFEGTRCDTCNEKTAPITCDGLDYLGQKCKFKKINGTDFCDNHKDLLDYTPEMLANQAYCRMGNHYRYCGEYNSCVRCHKTGKKYREIAKEEREKQPMCLKCGIHPKKVGDYCKLHYTCDIVASAAKQNMKICENVIRKCRTMMRMDYKYRLCPDCMAKTRISDKQRRDKRIAQLDYNSIENDRSNRVCFCCRELKDVYFFTCENGTSSRNCDMCRHKKRSYDLDRTIRNTMTNEKRIKEYIRCAAPNKRDKAWALTNEQALHIITQPCEYCGMRDDHANDNGVKYSMIGIDRYDNNRGYEPDNVKPACRMCNYMKYTHTYKNFILYCKNIYTHNGSTRHCPQQQYRSYEAYKRDAKRDEKPFRITRDEFAMILQNACYYCDGTNGSNQIGIDRSNSTFGYCLKTNKLVASCPICNTMKKDVSVPVFYNHIAKILLHAKVIDKITYDAKILQPTVSELEELTGLVRGIAEDNSNDCIDIESVGASVTRKSKDIAVHKPMRADEYYTEMIWKSYDISRLVPVIEYCESKSQMDMWHYYRDTTSSYHRTNNGGLKMLIKDAYTSKYLGIAELSYPSFYAMRCKAITDHISITGKEISSKKMQNIMNISTCVPLQPFGYNFCGGKLILKLMFSKEVYEYVYQKYKRHIYAMFSFSLNVDSMQYSGLSELEYIGKTAGYTCGNIKKSIMQRINVQLAKHGKSVNKHNIINVAKFCSMVGITTSAAKSAHRKGIYFGYTSPDAITYIQHDIDEQYAHSLGSANELITQWYFEHAVPRFADICGRGVVHVYETIGLPTGLPRDTVQQIVQEWAQGNNYVTIASKYNTDAQTVTRIIDGNAKPDPAQVPDQIIAMINEREAIQRDKKLRDNEMYMDVDIDMIEYRLNKNTQMCIESAREGSFFISMKKQKFTLYRHYPDTKYIATDSISYKKTDIVLENIQRGKWTITPAHLAETNVLLEMHYDPPDNPLDVSCDRHETFTHTLYDDGHYIQYMALYQTNLGDRLTINDANVYMYPHMFTGKDNILIANNKTTTRINIITVIDANGDSSPD